MRRVFVFVLALMLCAGALAENDYYGSPKMFFEENGLIVFSGDQLSQLGFEIHENANLPDFSFSILQIVDDAGGIVWYQNKTKEMFVAIDLTYLLSNGRKANIPNLAKTFIDFCKTFNFDLYRFRNNNVSVCCMPEVKLDVFAFALSLKEDTEAKIVKSIDQMADMLKESMY